MFYPCLFYPSDNLEHSLAHFYTYIGCVIKEGVKSIEKCGRTEARQRVGSATYCHLDKTNMDQTSMHHCGSIN